MNLQQIRSDFPILQRKIRGKPLVYLDNAATTQKPQQVIDAMSQYYQEHNANAHRGVHTLSQEATNAQEQARKTVASFVHCRPEEVIFTRNATEAINLVSHALGIKKEESVLSTVMEHHSNIVPWQRFRADFVDITDEGTLRMEEYDRLLTKKKKLVTAVHASNTLSTINDVKQITKKAHDAGALSLIDAAQSIPHMPIDFSTLDCDFLAFSGHKMLGPMGIGCLIAKRDLLEEMQPFLLGGDMIKEVHLDRTTYNDIPYKYEAGTPDVASAVGLGAAISYLNKIGMDNIAKHEQKLTQYALETLSDFKSLHVLGPKDCKKRTGVLSFTMEPIHPHDIATIVDTEGVAIRSGHNCTMPLLHRLGISAVARASVYLYNTKEEIDIFKCALEKCQRTFGV